MSTNVLSNLSTNKYYLVTTTATADINGTASLAVNRIESCRPQHPCEYADRVNIRIIVITYKRPESLLQLLQSLDDLELDGDSAALEIWIDRDRKTGAVDRQTVTVASEFQWSRGPTRVHVHQSHVGIYGQWIDTWRPPENSDNELALFVEDDLSVSKYAYRWVRAVFHAYSRRPDFVGASLTSHQMITLHGRPKRRLPYAGPPNHSVMMYKCFSSWGFAPKPLHWRRFQVCTSWLRKYLPHKMQFLDNRFRCYT